MSLLSKYLKKEDKINEADLGEVMYNVYIKLDASDLQLLSTDKIGEIEMLYSVLQFAKEHLSGQRHVTSKGLLLPGYETPTVLEERLKLVAADFENRKKKHRTPEYMEEISRRGDEIERERRNYKFNASIPLFDRSIRYLQLIKLAFEGETNIIYRDSRKKSYEDTSLGFRVTMMYDDNWRAGIRLKDIDGKLYFELDTLRLVPNQSEEE